MAIISSSERFLRMTADTLREWLMQLHKGVAQTNHLCPKNLARGGQPIPFFGDILNARVLTVGVNPSNCEFHPTRKWDAIKNPPQWERRLLNYFRIPEIPAYRWFETWSMCLELLGLSYARGEAAHADISPRATSPMLSAQTDKREFRAMVEHDVKWVFTLLCNLPKVRLLLVAGPVPHANGRKQQLGAFIKEQCAAHQCRCSTGDPLPKLMIPDRPDGIAV